MVHPQCDLEVELMQKERKHEVLSKGYVPKFEKDLDIVKQVVNIHKPLLTDQTPFEDQIKRTAFGCGISIFCIAWILFQRRKLHGSYPP
mgnify:FL=1